MELLSPKNWKEYELLDCGDFEKLERFGTHILIRPEPQAVWRKQLTESDWHKAAHWKFVPKSSSSGEWKRLKPSTEQWKINYILPNGKNIVFRLGLTSFKHVGIFPEQAVNWELIHSFFVRHKGAKFLNLFAYTGGASLAAKAAGADVTHVDSIKQVVSWANENRAASALEDIRWIIDDALKFVKKEKRRGNIYQGIILDPPAYGHGPNGEKWKLEENIEELIAEVTSIVDTKNHLLIFNAYSLGFSALVAKNLLLPFAGRVNSLLSVGELFLKAKSGLELPLGVWGRSEKK